MIDSEPHAGTRPCRMGSLAVWVTAVLTNAAGWAHGDTSLPALNSYAQPPFVSASADRAAGLAKTFVDLLNDALGSPTRFQLDNLPRRRLEARLEGRAFSGVALFLAPEFLAAAAQDGAVWSTPVMVDENLLVSMRPLNLSSIPDLHGMRLGGIAGHVYRLLESSIEAGEIRREDAPDHLSNLRKLCLGRIDFVIISRSELAGTQPHVACTEPFRSTAFPDPQVIVRRVLVRMSNLDEAQEVLDAVASVACGPDWTQALARFGLSTVGCRSALTRVQEPTAERAQGSRRARARGRPG